MSFITKCSYEAIQTGMHINPDNCILIQIVDIGMEFPQPQFKGMFTNIFQFEFMDVDYSDKDLLELGISESQAEELASIIFKAFVEEKNILVHCVAGICRSGGVCEAAEAYGFKYINPSGFNSPNLVVKHKIMGKLRIIDNE